MEGFLFDQFNGAKDARGKKDLTGWDGNIDRWFHQVYSLCSGAMGQVIDKDRVVEVEGDQPGGVGGWPLLEVDQPDCAG